MFVRLLSADKVSSMHLVAWQVANAVSTCDNYHPTHFPVSPAGCVIGLQFWFLFTSRASEISVTFHVSDTVVPQIIAGFDRVLGPGLKEILSKIFVSTYLISYIGCRSSIQHVKKQ